MRGAEMLGAKAREQRAEPQPPAAAPPAPAALAGRAPYLESYYKSLVGTEWKV